MSQASKKDIFGKSPSNDTGNDFEGVKSASELSEMPSSLKSKIEVFELDFCQGNKLDPNGRGFGDSKKSPVFSNYDAEGIKKASSDGFANHRLEKNNASKRPERETEVSKNKRIFQEKKTRKKVIERTTTTTINKDGKEEKTVQKKVTEEIVTVIKRKSGSGSPQKPSTKSKPKNESFFTESENTDRANRISWSMEESDSSKFESDKKSGDIFGQRNQRNSNLDEVKEEMELIQKEKSVEEAQQGEPSDHPLVHQKEEEQRGVHPENERRTAFFFEDQKFPDQHMRNAREEMSATSSGSGSGSYPTDAGEGSTEFKNSGEEYNISRSIDFNNTTPKVIHNKDSYALGARPAFQIQRETPIQLNKIDECEEYEYEESEDDSTPREPSYPPIFSGSASKRLKREKRSSKWVNVVGGAKRRSADINNPNSYQNLFYAPPVDFEDPRMNEGISFPQANPGGYQNHQGAFDRIDHGFQDRILAPYTIPEAGSEEEDSGALTGNWTPRLIDSESRGELALQSHNSQTPVNNNGETIITFEIDRDSVGHNKEKPDMQHHLQPEFPFTNKSRSQEGSQTPGEDQNLRSSAFQTQSPENGYNSGRMRQFIKHIEVEVLNIASLTPTKMNVNKDLPQEASSSRVEDHSNVQLLEQSQDLGLLFESNIEVTEEKITPKNQTPRSNKEVKTNVKKTGKFLLKEEKTTPKKKRWQSIQEMLNPIRTKYSHFIKNSKDKNVKSKLKKGILDITRKYKNHYSTRESQKTPKQNKMLEYIRSKVSQKLAQKQMKDKSPEPPELEISLLKENKREENIEPYAESEEANGYKAYMEKYREANQVNLPKRNIFEENYNSCTSKHTHISKLSLDTNDLRPTPLNKKVDHLNSGTNQKSKNLIKKRKHSSSRILSLDFGNNFKTEFPEENLRLDQDNINFVDFAKKKESGSKKKTISLSIKRRMGNQENMEGNLETIMASIRKQSNIDQEVESAEIEIENIQENPSPRITHGSDIDPMMITFGFHKDALKSDPPVKAIEHKNRRLMDNLVGKISNLNFMAINKSSKPGDKQISNKRASESGDKSSLVSQVHLDASRLSKNSQRSTSKGNKLIFKTMQDPRSNYKSYDFNQLNNLVNNKKRRRSAKERSTELLGFPVKQVKEILTSFQDNNHPHPLLEEINESSRKRKLVKHQNKLSKKIKNLKKAKYISQVKVSHRLLKEDTDKVRSYMMRKKNKKRMKPKKKKKKEKNPSERVSTIKSILNQLSPKHKELSFLTFNKLEHNKIAKHYIKDRRIEAKKSITRNSRAPSISSKLFRIDLDSIHRPDKSVTAAHKKNSSRSTRQKSICKFLVEPRQATATADPAFYNKNGYFNRIKIQKRRKKSSRLSRKPSKGSRDYVSIDSGAQVMATHSTLNNNAGYLKEAVRISNPKKFHHSHLSDQIFNTFQPSNYPNRGSMGGAPNQGIRQKVRTPQSNDLMLFNSIKAIESTLNQSPSTKNHKLIKKRRAKTKVSFGGPKKERALGSKIGSLSQNRREFLLSSSKRTKLNRGKISVNPRNTSILSSNFTQEKVSVPQKQKSQSKSKSKLKRSKVRGIRENRIKPISTDFDYISGKTKGISQSNRHKSSKSFAIDEILQQRFTSVKDEKKKNFFEPKSFYNMDVYHEDELQRVSVNINLQKPKIKLNALKTHFMNLKR